MDKSAVGYRKIENNREVYTKCSGVKDKGTSGADSERESEYLKKFWVQQHCNPRGFVFKSYT